MTTSSAALIGAAAMLAAGAWVLYQSSQDEANTEPPGTSGGALGEAGQILNNAAEETAQFVDRITMGTFNLSRMKNVTAADVAHPNIRAFLAVLRRGEGTAGINGYRTLFGGGLFESFAVHPNQRITRKMGGRNITSTAAGAFQFLFSTWEETRRLMGLVDFSPANQDRGAVGRIAARGALEDVKAGRFDAALSKVAKEWASMPGSPYGQPVISIQTARAVYASAGGNFA